MMGFKWTAIIWMLFVTAVAAVMMQACVEPDFAEEDPSITRLRRGPIIYTVDMKYRLCFAQSAFDSSTLHPISCPEALLKDAATKFRVLERIKQSESSH